MAVHWGGRGPGHVSRGGGLFASLRLDFLSNVSDIDPRITFTRASSATRVNSAGLIETVSSNVARIDYDPVTLACKGLLIEEQRTNLLLRSQEFDNASWSKVSGNSTVTANTVTAPDGTVTGDTITAVAGTGVHYVNQVVTPLTGTYTTSFYVKKGTATWIFFGVSDLSLNYFNLDTGAFGTAPDTCNVVSVGNGWYRISATRTLAAAAAHNGIGIASGNGGANFTAAGTETVHVWGAQLE